ncbi:MAG: Tar5 [Caloramator sp.]|jgi:methyl-accepting chemotaxis protein|uniref:methyl-accepting chemotaxis protein n=1 Tax=Caloramator sp. TaxID=1871330 RepID=UPI001DBBBB1A|nr:methyl-accepting chemotaxis protein [Caloramator sp.]MBZ4662962.1 Tar5 [Caloramator sp.]
MKKTKRGKLRNKLTSIIVLTAIIPLLLVSFILINNSTKLVEEKVNNLTKQISVEKVAYIDSLIDVSKAATESITKNEVILSGNREDIFSTLTNYKTSNPNFFQIYIGKQNKEFIIIPQKEMPRDYDPTQRPWYKDATSNFGNVIITKPYKSTTTGYMMVTVAKAFKLNDGTEAVVGIDITLEALIEHIVKTKVGDTGYAALILEDGTIIAHPNKEMVLKNIVEEFDFGKSMIETKSGNFKYKFNGENRISGLEQSKLTKWIVVSTMNESEYKKELYASIFKVIIILILTLIAIISLGYYLSMQITKPLINLSALMKMAAEGDYTIEVDVNQNNEIGDIQDSFRTMVESQKNMIKEIIENAHEVLSQSEGLSSISEEMASSSEELAKTIQQVAEGSSAQANDLQDIVAAMTDLSNKIENLYEELKNVKNETDNATDRAKVGKGEIERLVQSIDEIQKSFELVVDKVNNLTTSVKEINNITNTINTISEQTNLLALNAAIEAARAGDAGRGFAVVAEEVRKLAEESKKSTAEITQLINSIQMDVQEVINSSNNVNGLVKEQTNVVQNTVVAFGEILESVEKVAPLIDNTYREMNVMEKAKNDVLQKAEGVTAVVQENTAASEEVAASSEELSASSEEVAATSQSLSSMANNLVNAVKKFKVE